MARTDTVSARLDEAERAELERVKRDLALAGLEITDSDALRWLIRDSAKRRQQAAGSEGSK
jgi:hypothetical protein